MKKVAKNILELVLIFTAIILVIRKKITKKKREKTNKQESKAFYQKKKFYEDYQKRGGTWDYEDANYFKEATGHEYKNNNDYDFYNNYSHSNYNNTSNNGNYSNNSNNTYKNTKTETKSGNDFYAVFSALEPDMAKITYSNFVKKYHPDNGGDMEVMKAINEAYNKYKKEKGVK